MHKNRRLFKANIAQENSRGPPTITQNARLFFVDDNPVDPNLVVWFDALNSLYISLDRIEVLEIHASRNRRVVLTYLDDENHSFEMTLLFNTEEEARAFVDRFKKLENIRDDKSDDSDSSSDDPSDGGDQSQGQNTRKRGANDGDTGSNSKKSKTDELPDLRNTSGGAGQMMQLSDRSCLLISIGGKNVMLDCGMHIGFSDERRFPDFKYIGGRGLLTDYLDAVIISHFHLDHCGALPYMSEMVGYEGPIYLIYPSKAIVPVLLEDYRKVQTEFRGETNFFTSAMIKACMKKVIPVNLHETINIDEELTIQAFYASRVLGAVMFLARVWSESVLYTGDFNMTPDRHLGPARGPR